VLTPR